MASRLKATAPVHQNRLFRIVALAIVISPLFNSPAPRSQTLFGNASSRNSVSCPVTKRSFQNQRSQTEFGNQKCWIKIYLAAGRKRCQLKIMHVCIDDVRQLFQQFDEKALFLV